MAPPIIVSGPSGCGKSTIIRRLLAEMPRLRLSMSVTTRQPRINEQPGVHYHNSWSVPDFVRERDRGEFLEWAEVHGKYYGTLESEVTPSGEAALPRLSVDLRSHVAIRDARTPLTRAAHRAGRRDPAATQERSDGVGPCRRTRSSGNQRRSRNGARCDASDSQSLFK